MLLDSLEDVDFFRLMMKKCVEFSNYIVRQVSSTGVHDMVINEVFLTPGNLNPHFFKEEVEPYIQAVLDRNPSSGLYFYQKDFLADGLLEDGLSKKGLATALCYGTKECLEVIRQGLKLPIPGYPLLVTISGRSLVQSSIHDILDFIRQGIYIILDEGVCNPCIYLTSIQASSRKEALEIAEKINQIREFRERIYRYKIDKFSL